MKGSLMLFLLAILSGCANGAQPVAVKYSVFPRAMEKAVVSNSRGYFIYDLNQEGSKWK